MAEIGPSIKALESPQRWDRRRLAAVLLTNADSRVVAPLT